MKEKSSQKLKQEKLNKQWHVYLLKSEKTGEFYCGVTTDLNRRIKEHNEDNKKGAKWTRSKRPLALVWSEAHDNRSIALKREATIKKMAHMDKERTFLPT